jgi:hypothetical protein
MSKFIYSIHHFNLAEISSYSNKEDIVRQFPNFISNSEEVDSDYYMKFENRSSFKTEMEKILITNFFDKKDHQRKLISLSQYSGMGKTRAIHELPKSLLEKLVYNGKTYNLFYIIIKCKKGFHNQFFNAFFLDLFKLLRAEVKIKGNFFIKNDGYENGVYQFDKISMCFIDLITSIKPDDGNLIAGKERFRSNFKLLFLPNEDYTEEYISNLYDKLTERVKGYDKIVICVDEVGEFGTTLVSDFKKYCEKNKEINELQYLIDVKMGERYGHCHDELKYQIASMYFLWQKIWMSNKN